MANSAPKRGSHPIQVHSTRFVFDESTPRVWFWESPAYSHLMNSISATFPVGERFFVRSVHRYQDRVTDPLLREQIKAFCVQEGNHSREHSRHLTLLEQQGYPISRVIAWQERLTKVFNFLFSDKTQLAITAGAEHLTALFGAFALRAEVFKEAPPVLRDIWNWHAAEEIEHKTVAFDVYQSVAPRGYLRRMWGFFLAQLIVGSYIVVALIAFTRVDGLSWRQVLADFRGKKRPKTARLLKQTVLPQIRAYLHPGFHPSDVDDYALAEHYFHVISERPAPLQPAEAT